MSVAFIDANRHRWPVAVMCEVLELSERTYYAAKKRTEPQDVVGIENVVLDVFSPRWRADLRECRAAG